MTQPANGMDLVLALTIVKSAGYKVTKPKPRKPSVYDRLPVFVTRWDTGDQTRMTCFTRLDKLDHERGLRTAQAVMDHRGRTGKILESWFELDKERIG